ncbi:MAG: deoxyuridine 5'-triphosphate nucleotidohydrolase [Candidatus Poribacteria bacterium]|nr:MAG: deoxyuridine 5'-triphosphate nucleotidohydrolase [Candidatus Poribacteria bacterium]
MQLRVQRLRPGARLPTRGSQEAAGWDLYAALEEPILLKPGETVRVPTGLALEIPAGHFGLIKDRSSWALRGLRTSAGVIDADYRGEVQIVLTNYGDEIQTIQPGERVAQLILIRYERAELVEAERLEATRRGSGGFGSTGR